MSAYKQNLFGEPDSTTEVARLSKRRRSKPAARTTDPASSHAAAGRFRDSRGVETHEVKIINAIDQKMKSIYADDSLSHAQIMRRTKAMSECGMVRKGEVRLCSVCGHGCQELLPSEDE